MTEEERNITILELERANCKFPSTAEDLGLQHYRETHHSTDLNEPKCEICDMELIDGECEAHPQHMRMHRRAIRQIRNQQA
jgi:hypothetical protein